MKYLRMFKIIGIFISLFNHKLPVNIHLKGQYATGVVGANVYSSEFPLGLPTTVYNILLTIQLNSSLLVTVQTIICVSGVRC